MAEPSSDADAAPSLRLRLPYLLLSVAVLVADQWSKWAIEHTLPVGTSVEVVPGVLDFAHVRNTGVAFGLLATHGSWLGTLGLLLLGGLALGLVLWMFRRTPVDDRLLLSALGLILGGAVGNLVDRLAAGWVTDFIDFYVNRWHWHTFNLADSAITIGIGLMLIDLIRPRRSKGSEAQDEPVAGS